MATHSNVLAWRIPGSGEPGGLPSMGLQRVRHDWVTSLSFFLSLLAWEMSAVVWWLAHSLILPFLGIGMRIDLFQSYGHSWVFQICWQTECNILMASCFRVLNSSPRIPSHPRALLTAVLPKAHITCSPECLALGGWPHHCSNPIHLDLFCTVLPCILSISSWSLQCLLCLHSLWSLLCPSLGKMFTWYLQFSQREISSLSSSFVFF